MWRLRNEIALCIVAIAIVLLSTHPQARTSLLLTPPQQAQQTPIFRSGAEVVRLDISVLDGKRKPVRGLTAEDFYVKEDGKPQPIVAFSEIEVPKGRVRPVWERASEPDVASNDLGEHRLFAIVLDSGVKPNNNAPRTGIFDRPQNPRIAKGLREIVQAIIDRLGPDDVAAITGGTCFQPFTNDHEALESAIEAIDPFGAPCPPRLTHIINIPSRALVYDVAAYVAAAPQRRKVLIYIGPGIDLDTQLSLRGADDVNEAVQSARRGNVNIYAINTIELDGSQETPRTKLARMESLRELANHTGGMAIMDLENYPAGLDQLFQENGSYYMLGYRATGTENDGRRHDISVKIPGQDNLLVRTRSAILRPKPASPDGSTTAADPAKDLAPDLQGLVPNLDVTFNTDVLTYARPGSSKAAVAIISELAEPVPPGMTRIVQQMDVRLIAYDERGNVSAQTSQRASIDLAPSADGLIRYRVMTRWDLAPGPYKLRLVAQNPVTRKLANMEFDMTVPDFSARAVSLSGVAITASPDPSQPPAFGTVAPVLEKAPTVTREFNQDTILAADMHVYQGGTAPPDPVTMEVALLDSDGARVFSRVDALAPDRFQNGRSADYHLDLLLESFDLRPGEYLLTFQANLGTRHSPRRDIRFSVR